MTDGETSALPRRMTVKMLAQHWGVSTQHIYNLVAEGKLGHLRIGDAIRFRAEDVESYEARQWHAPAPNAPRCPSPAAQGTGASSSGTGPAPVAFLAGQRMRRQLGGS